MLASEGHSQTLLVKGKTPFSLLGPEVTNGLWFQNGRAVVADFSLLMKVGVSFLQLRKHGVENPADLESRLVLLGT